MRTLFVKLVKLPIYLYSYLLSPFLGPKCRFHPSCSSYTIQAIDAHGAFKGILLGIKRVFKCHPWCSAHWHDPVPNRFTWRGFFGYKRGDCKHGQKKHT